MALIIEILSNEDADTLLDSPSPSTSTTVGDQLAVLGEQIDSLQYALLYSPRALQYARDARDQMRVNIGGVTGVNIPATLQPGTSNFGRVTANYGAEGNYPVWYQTVGSPTSMDPREQQRLLSEVQMHNVRTQRWVIT